MPKTWIELSRSALLNNVQVVKNIVKQAEILYVIKANAYGHGMVEIAQILQKSGCVWFGVDSIEEASVLRKVGITKKILILGFIPQKELGSALRLNVHFVISSFTSLHWIAKFCSVKGPANIHIKIDTGLMRQGFYIDELPRAMAYVKRHPELRVEGVLTHFANIEDTNDASLADLQIERFEQAVKIIQDNGLNPEFIHSACSAAIFLYPDFHRTMVRLGISLYGIASSEVMSKSSKEMLKLKPVLSWKTCIAQIKKVKSGTSIGYGLSERVKRNSVIAILPIGYADGFDRKLSSQGEVIIRGIKCKVVGRVCMNMCIVDITNVSAARVNDTVIIIGRSETAELRVDSIAKKISTISYEILARISPTIIRRVIP